jgi:outer membrane lipoprotein-sorting protein
MKRILLVTLLLLPALTAIAATPEERGLEIATKVERQDTGWHDLQATMTMLLRNRQGEESLRHMRSKSLEVEDDGDKTLIVFDRPRDVKGTALLSYSHKTGQDDQWLYLPALKRVKRIASKNKSGPFMGSEFAYEDLSSQEIEKYRYKYLKDDQLNDKPVFLIERDPVDPNSGYSYQHAWIDQQEFIPLKIDFYDRKKALLKTLEFRNYKKYLDRYWRADEMFMQNHQTGKSTLLTWEEYAFQNGLTESDFGKNSLKQAR